MKRLLILSLFFKLSFAWSQIQVIDNYFAQVREGKSPSFPNELFKIENIKTSMNRLPYYLKDSLAIIREQAYLLAKLIGMQSQWAPTRAQVVRWLIAGSRDNNSGNVGVALDHLTVFSKGDFTRSGKDSLKSLLNKKQPYIETLVKLIGFLEINEMESELNNLSHESSLGRKERWACMLALARLGNASATNDLMNRIQRMPIGDVLVHQVFPDLIYTRSKTVFDYLIGALNSNDKNCLTGDAEQEENVPCAYRVMELIAPVIENYPLKLDASGDIANNNYAESLKTVRDWFKNNPEYRIVTAKF